MKRVILGIDNYLLHNYTDSSIITRRKVSLLPLYSAIGLVVLPVHFTNIHFLANVPLVQLIAAMPVLFLLFISAYFLFRGKYEGAANIVLCTMLIFMSNAIFQNIGHSAMNVTCMKNVNASIKAARAGDNI